MGVHLPSQHAVRRACLRVLLALPVVALGIGVAVGATPTGAVALRPKPIAVAAKTLYISETANLRLVKQAGRVLNHQGTITGTLSGPVYTKGVALSTAHGEGTYTFYPKGGSISGKATTHGRVAGAYVYFEGVGTITSGTGVWAHVSSSGMHFSGVLDRQNFHISERFAGDLRY
jgi:hypothetical protein